MEGLTSLRIVCAAHPHLARIYSTGLGASLLLALLLYFQGFSEVLRRAIARVVVGCALGVEDWVSGFGELHFDYQVAES